MVDIVAADLEAAVQQMVSDILRTGPVAESIVKRMLSHSDNSSSAAALVDSLAGAYTGSVGETSRLLNNPSLKGKP